MKILYVGVTMSVLLAGCAQVPVLDRLTGGAPDTAPDTTAVDTGAPAPLPTPAAPAPAAQVAASPAALDTVSEAEKDAARASAASAPAGGTLGEVTVALGDPADPGLWVKSALVDGDTPGTVRTGDGDAITVTLRPLGAGAGGPQISLAALRALGLPLTGLHPVTIATSG